MDFLRMPAYQLFLHPITGGAIWGYVLAMIYLRYVRRFPQYKPWLSWFMWPLSS